MKTKIIVVASALLLGVLLSLWATCNKGKPVAQIATAIQDTGKRWSDQYGTEHLTKQVERGSYKELAVFSQRQMDSALKTYKINRKQLQGITNTQATVSGMGEAQVVPATMVDSVPGVPIGWEGNYFEWTDSFTKIEAYVDIAHDEVMADSSICTIPGKAVVFYTVNVPISHVTYWRRKHKFLWFRVGRKIYYMDVSSKNPNAVISNFQTIQVNE